MKKVLIIEDYPATAKMIAEILEMEGINASISPEGRSGIEKAASEKPNLILLDVMLPEMDGLAVCEKLKGDPKTKDIPVIFVSVKGTEEDIKAGMEKGATAYIPKPFDPFKLVEIVKKTLG